MIKFMLKILLLLLKMFLALIVAITIGLLVTACNNKPTIQTTTYQDYQLTIHYTNISKDEIKRILNQLSSIDCLNMIPDESYVYRDENKNLVILEVHEAKYYDTYNPMDNAYQNSIRLSYQLGQKVEYGYCTDDYKIINEVTYGK